ncbi:TetR/AcrR family transcriptional regulator [Prescottella equi]|uniref:TetR/AcrR family transcriptional regulator n=1 Tax=Rhodococcus hoagii TaxID=43767 RepID=UPI000D0FA2F5|nr:TetR/AcrR family transcriptional regulator [Prescottella equi]AVP71403.1 TetR family transcriptional regulator [Prescottella equi]MCD7052791.1 TetR/AcrR family transcriptional regulator [Rhodococcus sp. BH2-1]
MPHPTTTVDGRIVAAVLDLLRSRGASAVTIEAVSTLSGVAKTTIYRRYSDRREMLTAALAPLASPSPLDATLDARQRLTWVLEQAVASIEDGIGFGGMAALLTGEDPEFSELFLSILASYRRQVSDVIEEARNIGEFRRDLDSDALIDAIVGAYVAEFARQGQVRDDWQQRLFRIFWPTVKNSPSP